MFMAAGGAAVRKDFMLRMWWARVGTGSGLLSVVLGVVAAVVVPQPPEMNDSFPKVYAYLATHRTGLEVDRLLAVIGSLFALVFVAYLWSVLQAAEGDAGGVSMLALIGGAGSVIVGWVESSVVLVAVTMTNQNTDGGLRGLYDLTRLLDYFAVIPLFLFLGAAAAVVVTTRVLPWWLGWSAAVLAIALLLMVSISIFSPSVAQGVIGLVLRLLFLLWVGVTSVLLAMRTWSRVQVDSAVPDAASV
jgi:hypothetical protein